jgi:hypothetical protein
MGEEPSSDALTLLAFCFLRIQTHALSLQGFDSPRRKIAGMIA